VIVIYVQAAISKLGVPEWLDGTAMYYWLNNSSFGAPLALRGFLNPLLEHGWFVVALSWGSILVEMAIALAMVAPEGTRLWGLRLSVVLHLTIIVLMGLFSFGLTMVGLVAIGCAESSLGDIEPRALVAFAPL